jgi:hypothetical protein
VTVTPRATGQERIPSPPISTSARIAPMRLEYKFLADFELLPELRAALAPYTCLDRLGECRPNKQYTVRSIYYDTRRFHCYQEKFDGFRLKKKLRIRGYDTPAPDSAVFLEMKYKYGDFIGKHRAPMRWDQVQSVFSGYGTTGALPFPPGSKQADAARRFLYNYYRRRMLPVVMIAYEREAFYSRFDSTLRLTFDKNVRSRLYPTLDSLYQDRDAVHFLPDHFVFEIKFYDGCLPRWVRTVLTRFDLERIAVSKFGMGIECQRVEKKDLRGVAHTVEFLRSPKGDMTWKH